MTDKLTANHRVQRVESLINTALNEVIRNGKQLDIRLIEVPVTFTRVEVTKDLKVANCYFLPFNTVLNKDELSDALNKSKFVIRNFITKKINLKYSTEIRFHFDHAFENANLVDQLLRNTK